MKKGIYIAFFFLFSVHSLFGQQYYTRNLNINDGLPDNCISAMFIDSKGFLWIGTPAGIARFDGQSFKISSSLDGLASNDVRSITETEDGSIWFGCYNGGLSKFDGQNFTTFTINDGLLNNNVTKLFFCKSQKLLFVGTSDGLSVYDGNSFVSFHSSLNNVKQRIHVTDFLESKNSIYVLTLSNGMFKFLPETRKIIRVNSDNKLNSESLFASHVSHKNDTLISTNRRGFKIVNSKLEYYDNIGQVECFASDIDSSVWIGSWQNNNSNLGGLYKMTNNKVEKYNSLLGIDSEKIKSLLFDKNEKVLWIGTEDNGLYLYPGDVFSYYSANFFNQKKFSIKDQLIDNKNNIWLLTENSVIKKFADDRFTVFGFKDFLEQFNRFKISGLKTKYQYLIDKEGSYEKYQSLIESGNYPFTNPYIRYFNNRTKTITAGSLYKPNRYDILIEKSFNQFTNIRIDKFENIWVGCNTGLFKIDQQTNEIQYFDFDGNYFTHFAFGTNNELIITSWDDALIFPEFENNPKVNQNFYSIKNSPKDVKQVKSYKNKTFFITSEHGIYLYENFTFQSLKMKDSSETVSINDICFDNSGNVIIGGNDGIIYFFSLEENNLIFNKKISKQNGLSGTNILWLNYTIDNKLFVGTNTGINIINCNNYINKSAIEIEKLDKTIGYTDYTGKVTVFDNEKNLWVGTNSQLIKINTPIINSNKSITYHFVIKSIEINGEPYPISKNEINNLTNTEIEVILPWYKNSISVSYDAIKFTGDNDLQFVYTLYDGKKIESKETKDRKLVFQNLKPGNYILKICAFSDKGFDITEELILKIIIKQAFWKIWWVILSLVFVLFLIIWLIIHYRTQRIEIRERKRNDIAEKITEFELKALRAQMNPHFIFNAINSIQNYMLSNDVDAALNYLSDFAKLIRITLENVSKKMVTIEEELNYINYYLRLEQMRFDKTFNTQINVANDIDCNKIMIPPMIIQPYIENAIKHGLIDKDKESYIKVDLCIRIENNNQYLHCLIEDNGVGRKRSEELAQNNKKSNTSKGTYITNERLSLLNQTHHRKGFKVETTDLFDEQNSSRGTLVEIIFPI